MALCTRPIAIRASRRCVRRRRRAAADAVGRSQRVPPRVACRARRPAGSRGGRTDRHSRTGAGPRDGSRSRRSRTTSQRQVARVAGRRGAVRDRREERGRARARCRRRAALRPGERGARGGRHRRGVRAKTMNATVRDHRLVRSAGEAAADRGARLEGRAGQARDGRRRGAAHGRDADLSQDPRRRVGEAWTKAGVAVDATRPSGWRARSRTMCIRSFMMGRGLGHYSGALAAMSSVSAWSGLGSARRRPGSQGGRARSRARGVPRSEAASRRSACSASCTCRRAAGDPKLIAKAAGKFNYATDLAPDDIAVAARRRIRDGARGQARGRARAVQEARHAAPVGSRRALPARRRAVARRRRRGRREAARAGHRAAARIISPARRVLVLIHASRSDTKKLVAELEAIAVRAPDDLEVKADLATAYGALGKWDKAIANARADREGRGRTTSRCSCGSATRSARRSLSTRRSRGTRAPRRSRRNRACRASRPRRRCSMPAARRGDPRVHERCRSTRRSAGGRARARRDRDRAESRRRCRVVPAPGVAQGAAQPRRRAAPSIAAELMRKDAPAALAQLAPALVGWPTDATLHYLAGIAHHLAGDDAPRARSSPPRSRQRRGLRAPRTPRSSRSAPMASVTLDVEAGARPAVGRRRRARRGGRSLRR